MAAQAASNTLLTLCSINCRNPAEFMLFSRYFHEQAQRGRLSIALGQEAVDRAV
jgi:hypothetical protein